MDSRLHSDISICSFICPNCHRASFGEHFMAEYSREWNKCSGCGYMESKTTTRARILNVLAPEELTEPFIDPLLKTTNKSISMDSKAKDIKENNKCDNCGCDTSND